MRIAIVGAQCTGKTTLMKSLEAAHILGDEYVFKSEIVRTLMKEKGISVNKHGDFISQKAVFDAHLQNALANPCMVTDRSCLDAWVYTLYNYQKGCFTEQEFKELRAMFTKILPFYDIMFYLPVEFDIVPDGVRSIDEEYQRAIDNLFRQLLVTFKVNHFILHGGVEERLTQIKQYLCVQ